MNSHKKFTNNECEYFPCHKGIKAENFNCLFCYCPLYTLKDECGGNPKYLENGKKDCSDCSIIHNGEHAWEHVQSKITDVIELGKENNYE